MADIHLDEYYSPGSNTDCGEPVCCRAADGAPKGSSKGAGFWGDYRQCDIPERTLDSLFSHLAKKEKVSLQLSHYYYY